MDEDAIHLYKMAIDWLAKLALCLSQQDYSDLIERLNREASRSNDVDSVALKALAAIVESYQKDDAQ